MTFISQCDSRKKIRAQLLKEWNAAGEPPKKDGHKQHTGLCKKSSARSKFLSKPKNRKPKDEPSNEMLAMKKKPKPKGEKPL
jgi:hypothetical protein